MNEYFTMDSFGCDLPANWAALCEFLNRKAAAMIGPDDDEKETTDRIWEDFCAGDYDDEPDFPGYLPISRFEGYTFSALPADLQDAAERFWEPGYDYDDADFWARYKAPDPDLIYAVRMYDKEHRPAPVTRAWKVYGRDGHRQRESFNASGRYDFSTPGNVRIIELLNSDITGTNDYTIIRITRNTAEECQDELEGQLSDGTFENSRRGRVEEITEAKP